MYNEENNNRRTTLLTEDIETVSRSSSTTQKPSVGFTPVTKNKSRLKVTNTATPANEVGKTSKPKEKVQGKNIAMMVVYSIVALALATVIAVNAVSLGALSTANTQLSAELSSLEATYSTLSAELSAVSSVERMTELAASQLDLSATSVSTASYSIPGYIETTAKTFENNWFDVMLDKLV
ncbi:MAG: hypothetical protein R3Y32_05040 [Bacillota bacterium]